MNLKTKFAAALILLAPVFAGACSDDDDPAQVPTQTEDSTSLKVLIQDVEVSAKGGNSFTAYRLTNPLANAQPEAKTDVDWITDFNYDVAERISFKVAPNKSAQGRDAVVRIIYPGIEPAPEFKVHQLGATVYDEKLSFDVKGVKFDMIFVEGATFDMGATPEQKPGSPEQNEYPVHEVTLSNYYIGQCEVTQELWETVLGVNPSVHKGNSQYPVDNISWDDAKAFVDKLNTLCDGRFAMPTEAQWEFAARGGVKSEGWLYCGDREPEPVAWFNENSTTTHKVGELAPNELGLYDMSGNVGEWCQDWFAAYPSDPVVDPVGAKTGECRVWRGGSFFNFRQYVRPAFRGFCFQDRANDFFGLRLVLNLDEE